MPPAVFTIPFDRLPAGFAEGLDEPGRVPATPRPAATIVLLRPKEPSGLEVLLLKRVRSAGFVPGAYVFPGGRVDAEDAGVGLISRTAGLDPHQATGRLMLADDSVPPALAYYLAAVREAFEETGILLAIDRENGRVASAFDEPDLEQAVSRLLDGEETFAGLLDRLDLRVDAAGITYVAHWVTPIAEPRRYDTRFFAAIVRPSDTVHLNRREMTDALWIEPAEALRRNGAGELPMVFPTIKTLEVLAPFQSPAGALAHFESRPVQTVLPRLVRTPTGVGLELPGDGEGVDR